MRKHTGEDDVSGDLPMKNPQIISDIQKCLEAMSIAANNYNLGQNLDGTKKIYASETGDVHWMPVGDGKKRVDALISEINHLKNHQTSEYADTKTIALLNSLLNSSSATLKKMVCDNLFKPSSGMNLVDHVVNEITHVSSPEYGPREEYVAPDSVKTLQAAVNCYHRSLESSKKEIFDTAKKEYDSVMNPPGLMKALAAEFSRLFKKSDNTSPPKPSDSGAPKP